MLHLKLLVSTVIKEHTCVELVYYRKKVVMENETAAEKLLKQHQHQIRKLRGALISKDTWNQSNVDLLKGPTYQKLKQI